MVIRDGHGHADGYAVRMVSVFGPHGVDKLFPDVTRAGRGSVGQDGDIFIVGPAHNDVMGPRAMDVQGTLQNVDADRRLLLVERDDEQGEGLALGRTTDPSGMQRFFQLLARFKRGKGCRIIGHVETTSGGKGPCASTG